MPKSRSRKKIDNKAIGKQKMMQNRINLFNNVYLRYMEKNYPVLNRFYRAVSTDNIKVSFIRKAALEMALQMKLKEAVESAKVKLLDKVETNGTERI